MIFMGMRKKDGIKIFCYFPVQSRIDNTYISYLSSYPAVQKNTVIIPGHKKTVS